MAKRPAPITGKTAPSRLAEVLASIEPIPCHNHANPWTPPYDGAKAPTSATYTLSRLQAEAIAEAVRRMGTEPPRLFEAAKDEPPLIPDEPGRVAWHASWSFYGSSSHHPCTSYAHARSWLARHAYRNGATIPEDAIPMEPDDLVGWKYSTIGRGVYAIRKA